MSRAESMFQEKPSDFSNCNELNPKSARSTSYFLSVSKIDIKFLFIISNRDWSPLCSSGVCLYFYII